MSSSYVWRAAIMAAVLNALLNPTVVLLGDFDVRYMPVLAVIADVVLSSVTVALVVNFFGVRRVKRALKQREAVLPHSGTAFEDRILARLPSKQWLFAFSIGAAAGLLPTLVLGVCALLGFEGLAFSDFGLLMSLYTGALAFLVMRWTILHELMAHLGQLNGAAR